MAEREYVRVHSTITKFLAYGTEYTFSGSDWVVSLNDAFMQGSERMNEIRWMLDVIRFFEEAEYPNSQVRVRINFADKFNKDI